MIDLGTIGDGYFSKALGINNNGEIVGSSEIVATPDGFVGNQIGDYHAFVWIEEFGMQRLEDFVIDLPHHSTGVWRKPWRSTTRVKSLAMLCWEMDRDKRSC